MKGSIPKGGKGRDLGKGRSSEFSRNLSRTFWINPSFSSPRELRLTPIPTPLIPRQIHGGSCRPGSRGGRSNERRELSRPQWGRKRPNPGNPAPPRTRMCAWKTPGKMGIMGSGTQISGIQHRPEHEFPCLFLPSSRFSVPIPPEFPVFPPEHVEHPAGDAAAPARAQNPNPADPAHGRLREQGTAPGTGRWGSLGIMGIIRGLLGILGIWEWS